jgi:hypothetical protein
MHITKTLTAPNGAALAHHVVMKVLLEHPSDFLQVLVHSWPDAAAHEAGYPSVWQWSAVLQLSGLALGPGLKQAVLGALIAEASFVGGVATI